MENLCALTRLKIYGSNCMSYVIEFEQRLQKQVAKAGRKNPAFKNALENKIIQIREDPYRFKPLHAPLQNMRRVHLLKSFVLIYSIDESQKIVRVLAIEHHDDSY